MKPETTEERLLDRAMEHVSREAREMLLDALYCRLHNRGHDLEGNKEENDLDWFAHRIYNNCGSTFSRGDTAWPHLVPSEKNKWLHIVRVTLELLPLLMSRIANRCIVQSQAIRQLLDAHQRISPLDVPAGREPLAGAPGAEEGEQP